MQINSIKNNEHISFGRVAEVQVAKMPEKVAKAIEAITPLINAKSEGLRVDIFQGELDKDRLIVRIMDDTSLAKLGLGKKFYKASDSIKSIVGIKDPDDTEKLSRLIYKAFDQARSKYFRPYII